MNLTSEQQRAIDNGKAVEVTVDGRQCVLLNREMYDRVKQVIEYDDSPPTKEEQLAALRHAGKLAGWDDPELDVYNDLDPRQS